MLKWLWQLVSPAPSNHASRRVILYSREGCHPCEDAWRDLLAAKKRLGFQLEKKDVDADPAATALYGDCVPVVLVDGKVRFRGQVNRILFERLFSS